MNYWALRREILISIDMHMKNVGVLITKARVSGQDDLHLSLLSLAVQCESLNQDLIRYASLISKDLMGSHAPQQGDNNGK